MELETAFTEAMAGEMLSLGRTAAALAACHRPESPEFSEAAAAARWHLGQRPQASVRALCPGVLSKTVVYSKKRPGERRRALEALELISDGAGPQFRDYCVEQLAADPPDRKIQLAIVIATQWLVGRPDAATVPAEPEAAPGLLVADSRPQRSDAAAAAMWAPVHQALGLSLRAAIAAADGGRPPCRHSAAPLPFRVGPSIRWGVLAALEFVTQRRCAADGRPADPTRWLTAALDCILTLFGKLAKEVG